MTRLASRFGAANLIRRDRPLTREELFRVVPSVFSEDKHESRSERYTYIPTISLLDSLQREGFQPFFACQTRVRDPGRREHTKHMLRLRREGQITGKQVPEIILLNSHDGTSSYQMLPGLFRAVCQNGLVCGESFGEVRVWEHLLLSQSWQKPKESAVLPFWRWRLPDWWQVLPHWLTMRRETPVR